MDTLALGRLPGISATDFPPFLARAPWWGGDLQTLRNYLVRAGASRASCRFQYHAGRSQDFADALAALPPELTRHGIVAIGYSLGANMLLKYLGERGGGALKGAVAVSAPLDLA